MNKILLFTDVTDVALKATPFGVAIYGILVFFLVVAVISLGKAYTNEKTANRELNNNVREMTLKFAEHKNSLANNANAEGIRRQLEDMSYSKLTAQGEKIMEMLRSIERKIDS